LKVIEESWSTFLNSIKNSKRDWRSLNKIYKPACLFAIINIIESNKPKKNLIDIIEILEEFNNIVGPVCSSATDKGCLPLWHLTRDNAWTCLDSNDNEISKLDFRNKKNPKSEKELISKCKKIKFSEELGLSWLKPSNRDLLKHLIISILSDDNHSFSQAFGEYLKIRYLGIEKLNAVDFYEDDFEKSNNFYLVEDYSKFRFHRVIERNLKNISEVKKHQGYKCKICNFDFKKVYGKLGENFIEAHHIVPVSQQGGKQIKLDPCKDFLVLCANCHRMIHRSKKSINDKEFLEEFGKPKVFFS